MPPALDKEKMLQILRDFYKEHGRTPVCADFNKGTPNSKTFFKYFGSWNNTLELAGLLDIKNPKRQPKVYSDEELLEKLKDYCIKYGSVPSKESDNYEFSYSTYTRRFGNMKKALELIDMEYLWGDKDKFTKRWTKDELLNILIKFCKDNNKIPINYYFVDKIPNSQAFLNQWNSWDDILIELKNYVPHLKNDIDDFLYKYTKEEMINRLKLYYKETGEIPTYNTIKNKEYMPSYHTYLNKFGDFKTALIEADLYKYVKNKKNLEKRYYTDEVLLNLLKNYIEINNIIPSTREIDSDFNMPCFRTYEDRFGSYFTVLDKIGYLDQYIIDNPALKNWSNEEMLNNIYVLYLELGRRPVYVDVDICKYTPYSHIYFNRFGNLRNALNLANVPYQKRKSEMSDEEIIEYWYNLKDELGRIPTIKDLKNDDLHLVDMFYIKDYYRPWNTYTDFLIAIDEFKNLNNTKYRIYFTKNGVKCLSYDEYIITSWLENNNICFQKEIYYKDILPNENTNRRIDWIIFNNNKIHYIEYFGMMNNEKYKQRALKKIEDFKKNNMELIEIYPGDMKIKSLEEIFSFLD